VDGGDVDGLNRLNQVLTRKKLNALRYQQFEIGAYLVPVIEPDIRRPDVGQDRDQPIVEPRYGAGLTSGARIGFDRVVDLKLTSELCLRVDIHYSTHV
jgi:hypothetical protein